MAAQAEGRVSLETPKFRTILGGRAVTPPTATPAEDGTGFGFFTHLPAGTSLRGVVAASARIAGVRMIDRGRPVAVELDFRFARPPAHYRRDGSVRCEYLYVATSRLADDLAREVLVGLIGMAWVDSMQVARLVVEKRYAESQAECGVRVRITELEAHRG